MLEPPLDVQEEQIVACLEKAYGLAVTGLAFLPLGADVDTAAYRVTVGSACYFLKLRRGNFAPESVAIPYRLARLGMRWVIPPVATVSGALWARLDQFAVILYPYVTGRSGWDVDFSAQQWRDLGTALRQLHTAELPEALTNALPRETYTAEWRRQVKRFLDQAAEKSYADPVAAALARVLQEKATVIRHIVSRADQLADELVHEQPSVQLCHGDIHVGNVLLDSAQHLYVVDWDTLVMAPKERDLMFVGGGVGGKWNQDSEAASFYEGYGPTPINMAVLTYYRYERIVQDIAAMCEEIFGPGLSGEDRRLTLEHFCNQFAPNNVVDIAYRTDEEFRVQRG